MAASFNGKIALDIRESTPDWEPYLSPSAKEGAPNVLILAWDDVGYGTMDVFGGPVETPNMRRIADRGVQVRELPHDGTLFAHPGIAPHGSQRDQQRHGNHRGVLVGLSGNLDAYPVRKRIHLRGARRARVQHVLRRQVAPDAGGRVQPCRLQRALAARPRVRTFLRLARGRDQQLVSRPRSRQPPDRSARASRGRLSRRGRPVGQGDRVHPRREGHRARQALLHVLRTPSGSRARIRCRSSGPTSTRARSTRVTRRSAPASWRVRSRWDCCPKARNSRRSIRTESLERTSPDGKPWPALDTVRPWDSLSADEQRLFRGWPRSSRATSRTGMTTSAVSSITSRVRASSTTPSSSSSPTTARVVRADPMASSTNGVSSTASPSDPPVTLEKIDELGTPKSYNHYNTGWAWAFDTPFPYWKRWAGAEGGVADMCLVSWPAKIKRRIRRPGSSTSTQSTSCRRSTSCSRSSHRRRSRDTSRVPSKARASRTH